MNKFEFRVRVLLSVQSSFLGAITENIRAVICCWQDDLIEVQVIFDGAISEMDAECMSEVESEIMSHFPECDVRVDCHRVDIPSPILIKPEGVFTFKRKES